MDWGGGVWVHKMGSEGEMTMVTNLGKEMGDVREGGERVGKDDFNLRVVCV